MQLQSKKIAVISLSGGLDSSCLLIRLLSLGYEVHGVSFNYGQKHQIELSKLRKNIDFILQKNLNLASYNLLDISQLGLLFESSLINNNEIVPEGHYEEENMKSTVVPNRNMIFASIIQGLALSIANREKVPVQIALGVHSGDHAIYPDCTPEFYRYQEMAFKAGNWNSDSVTYLLPYINGNKTTILEDFFFHAKRLELTKSEQLQFLATTHTSYNPDILGRSSGTSGSDIERVEAFLNLNMEDPAEYVNGWDWTKNHVLTILKQKNETPKNLY
jgi:7-cyano-7-deazaguanine synthase